MVARLPNYLSVPRRRASTMIRCRWRSCEPLFFIKLITDSSAASSLGALINCAPRSVVSRGATFLCLISFLCSHFCWSGSPLPVLQGLCLSLVAFLNIRFCSPPIPLPVWFFCLDSVPPLRPNVTTMFMLSMNPFHISHFPCLTHMPIQRCHPPLYMKSLQNFFFSNDI